MAEEEEGVALRASKIIYNDLSKEHTDTAISLMNEALNNFKTEKDVATELKKAFDAKYSVRCHGALRCTVRSDCSRERWRALI